MCTFAHVIFDFVGTAKKHKGLTSQSETSRPFLPSKKVLSDTNNLIHSRKVFNTFQKGIQLYYKTVFNIFINGIQYISELYLIYL